MKSKTFFLLMAFLFCLKVYSQPFVIFNDTIDARVMEVVNNQIFIISRSTHSLYITDGVAQPQLVKILSTAFNATTEVLEFTSLRGIFYFSLLQHEFSSDWYRVWRSDGTAAGTYILKQSTTNHYCGYSYAIVRDSLFIMGGDSIYKVSADNSLRGILSSWSFGGGGEPKITDIVGFKDYIVYDNHIAGRYQAYNIYTQAITPLATVDTNNSNSRFDYIVYDDTLFITSRNDQWHYFVKIGADLSYSIPDTSMRCYYFVGRINDKILFNGSSSSSSVGGELSSYNVSIGSFTLVKDIYPGSNSSSPRTKYSNNARIIFNGDTNFGVKTWITDGTTAGTVLWNQSGVGGAPNLDFDHQFLHRNVDCFMCNDELHTSRSDAYAVIRQNSSTLYDLISSYLESPSMWVRVSNTVFFSEEASLSANPFKLFKFTCNQDTGCSANFSIFPDTTQQFHYFAVNNANGTAPLNYEWSWGDGSYDYTAYPSHVYADSGYYDICLSITDSIGCSKTYCSNEFLHVPLSQMIYVNVISATTGIQNSDFSMDGFRVYPNPVANDFKIYFNNISSNASVQILNIFGVKVYEAKIESQITTINKKLCPGVYFVNIKNPKESMVQKLVIE
jgi:hypothetical protein